ncbi:MAG: hypothetical protein ACI9OH_003282 [Oleispira sp.]|jgi:hypothetical protein
MLMLKRTHKRIEENMLNKLLVNGRVFCLLLLALILSLYGAWMVNAKLGYGYSWLYGFYETEQHIAYYAPQNRYRQGFETTSVAEHKYVFQQIVDSVHADGEGLADISYQYSGKTIPLLHQAERIHLQDVANLINFIHSLAMVCLLLFIICFAWEFRHRGNKHTPSKTQFSQDASPVGLLSVFALLLAFMAAAFFIWGAKAIFYQMHILVFPEDHQWFFYYQDSLMSTLMKAPDLFAGIAVQIVLVAVILYAVILLVIKKLLALAKTAQDS